MVMLKNIRRRLDIFRFRKAFGFRPTNLLCLWEGEARRVSWQLQRLGDLVLALRRHRQGLGIGPNSADKAKFGKDLQARAVQLRKLYKQEARAEAELKQAWMLAKQFGYSVLEGVDGYTTPNSHRARFLTRLAAE